MADKGISINVGDLKALQKRIGNIPKQIEQEVDVEMAQIAKEYEAKAVRSAPVDEGFLKGQISMKRNGLMDYEVVSGAFYSPYVEWGTKNKAKVPDDLTAYAEQWRNKKVTKDGFYEFVLRILEWMKRKGIKAGTYNVKTRRRQGNKQQKFEEDLKLATGIVYSILKNGVKPQPFFFIHRKEMYAKLDKKVEPAVERAMKK